MVENHTYHLMFAIFVNIVYGLSQAILKPAMIRPPPHSDWRNISHITSDI